MEPGCARLWETHDKHIAWMRLVIRCRETPSLVKQVGDQDALEAAKLQRFYIVGRVVGTGGGGGGGGCGHVYSVSWESDRPEKNAFLMPPVGSSHSKTLKAVGYSGNEYKTTIELLMMFEQWKSWHA